MKSYLKKQITTDFIPDQVLDFHEIELLDNYNIEKILVEFIEDNYLAENEKLLVITGKGKVVKPQVLLLLKQNKFIKSYNFAGYYNGQDGAIEIILKQ